MTKLKNFLSEIKANKEKRTRFLGVMTAIILVCAVSVVVPIIKHGEINTEAVAASETVLETSITQKAENTSAESSTAPAVSSTLTTTAAAESTTSVNASGKAEKKASTTKKSNAVSTNNSSSIAKTSTTKKATTTKKVTTTKKAVSTTAKVNSKSEWTQADVNAAVAEAKRYARSKGYTIYEDSKLKVKIDGNSYNTSWSSPIDTRWDSKDRVNSDLHYQINQINKNNGSLAFLHGDEGIGVNIFSISYGSYWEIYVVY